MHYAAMRHHLLEARAHFALGMPRQDGIINLTVHSGWEIQLTDDILRLFGLDDGLGGR